jgi:hypothetical protein
LSEFGKRGRRRHNALDMTRIFSKIHLVMLCLIGRDDARGTSPHILVSAATSADGLLDSGITFFAFRVLRIQNIWYGRN